MWRTSCNLMASGAKKIRLESTLVAVLHPKYDRHVESVSACIGTMENQRETKTVLQRLSVERPLLEFEFLKRVRKDEAKLDILISVGDQDDGGIAIDGISNVRQIQVPKFAPLTNDQFRECQQLWPCHFHPSKEIERLRSGQFFSTDELESLEGLMQQALESARHSAETGNQPRGGVVVNSNGDIVARGHDLSSIHPMFTCENVLIDLVARWQGGGALDIATQSPHLCHSSTPCDDTYLCTGLDVILTHEPDLENAMALLHSRVRRVIYGCTVKNGALGSRWWLHCQSGLNHHFLVFRGLSKEQVHELDHRDP